MMMTMMALTTMMGTMYNIVHHNLT